MNTHKPFNGLVINQTSEVNTLDSNMRRFVIRPLQDGHSVLVRKGKSFPAVGIRYQIVDRLLRRTLVPLKYKAGV